MRDFLRKMTISAVVTSCIIFGVLACCSAYSGIRKIGFGEYKSAVEIKDGEFRFFDFVIK